MVYTREVEGQLLDLGVSGRLWRDALVMYDRTTSSWFSQIDGRALTGPLKGARLREVPSVTTTWAEWKGAHPKTLVLAKGPRDRRSASVYEPYFASAEQLGVLGTRNPDERLPGKTLVLGLALDDGAVAVPVEAIGRRGLVNTSSGGTPLLLLADDEKGSGARAYHRRIEDRKLKFTWKKGQLIDTKTRSRWDPRSLVALDGPLAGTRLHAVPGHVVYWFVWSRFHPDTEIMLAPRRPLPATRLFEDRPDRPDQMGGLDP